MLCCAVAIIPKYSKCGVKLSARSCRSWRRAKLSLRPCWTTKPWFKLRLVAKSEYEGCRTNLQTFPENTVLIFLSCGLIRLLGVFMWAGQSRGTCKTIWEEMMEWMARNDSENVICFGLSFLAVIQSQHIRQRCWSWRPQIVYPVRGLDQGNQMLSKFFFIFLIFSGVSYNNAYCFPVPDLETSRHNGLNFRCCLLPWGRHSISGLLGRW